MVENIKTTKRALVLAENQFLYAIMLCASANEIETGHPTTGGGGGIGDGNRLQNGSIIGLDGIPHVLRG